MLRSYNWDDYFMTMAYLVSNKSKDPSTWVGAVLVGPDKEIRSTGYNGLPRGIADKEERYTNKEFKYLAGNHAEENAILNCVLIGASARGCTLYVTWNPCARCAKSIIQAGIKEVVYDPDFPAIHHPEVQDVWGNSMRIAEEILKEAGITFRAFSGDLIQIKGKCKGKDFDPFNK